jgi:hypothetical protein
VSKAHAVKLMTREKGVNLAMSTKCPHCSHVAYDYSRSHCDRCGHLIGWPNYRKALSERSELDARYQSARLALHHRGLGALLKEVERLAEASLPVVGMDAHACKDLLFGGKYRGYYRRVEIGERDVAAEAAHGDRAMVNERIYPVYGRHLQYAVLSPDGSGLSNYGPIAVTWSVRPHYLQERVSLLEENEFLFFDRHGLGALGRTAPAGYRAIWEDRAKLVVAKIGPRLNASTSAADIPQLLLREGSDRWTDVFVEVVMYAKEGVDSNDVIEVRLLKALVGSASQRAWGEIEEICRRRGIRIGTA